MKGPKIGPVTFSETDLEICMIYFLLIVCPYPQPLRILPLSPICSKQINWSINTMLTNSNNETEFIQ